MQVILENRHVFTIEKKIFSIGCGIWTQSYAKHQNIMFPAGDLNLHGSQHLSQMSEQAWWEQ